MGQSGSESLVIRLFDEFRRAFWVIATLALLVIFLSDSARNVADELAKRRALEAANQWLAQVDRQDYPASWDISSITFRRAESAEDWAKAAQHLRAPVGELTRRDLKSSAYLAAVPCLDDRLIFSLACDLNNSWKHIHGSYTGYFMMEYAASFKNKESAEEVVWIVCDNDRRWRVASYRLH